MFVAFISTRAPPQATKLKPRKIGGGGGGGGGEDNGNGDDNGGGGNKGNSGGESDNGDGGKSEGGSNGGNSDSGNSTSISVSASGSTLTATAFGEGGGKAVTIPAGQLFAGRESGGGTRAEVYGTSQYGSGYPGDSEERGVAGLGFPFVFWPIAWGGVVESGAGAYLHTSEYGRPDNTSRPGGPLTTATFVSQDSNTTFRLIADGATTTSLISNIQSFCSGELNNVTSSFLSTPYDDSLSSHPQPEQTVQYYRASSVALTLDGYNNTADIDSDELSDVPLPSNTDLFLLGCLNTTIGDAVPLVDSAPGLAPNMSILGLMYIIWVLSTSLF